MQRAYANGFGRVVWSPWIFQVACPCYR